MWVKSVQLWHLARSAVVYGLFAFILLALAYGGRRLLLWRRERNIRETQDVFELIEKVSTGMSRLSRCLTIFNFESTDYFIQKTSCKIF